MIESIRRAERSLCRANLDVTDIVANRSDAVPGMYRCVECQKAISLQESWRENNQLGTVSTLFCGECARKVSRLSGLSIQPFQASQLDNLNCGLLTEAMPISAPQPVAREISHTTRADILKKYGL